MIKGKNIMKKIFCLLLIVFVALNLSACKNNAENGNDVNEYVPEYNAVLYSKANEWIDDGFLTENRVKAYYPNVNYIEGESDPSEKYIYDKDAPASRTFIIDKRQSFAEIFTEYESEIDFDSKVVILHILSDVYPYREYYLSDIELDGTMTVYYELEKNDKMDATAPYQRCFMLILDKVQMDGVVFVKE